MNHAFALRLWLNNMPRLYYDFHIHTGLSPCADDDMTPNNIINMAAIKGLDVIAITDHNSALNARPCIEAAKNAVLEKPLTVIAGMELQTSEDVHIVCLFPDADNAENFELEIEKVSASLKNRPDIFGQQIIYGADDREIGKCEKLLSFATGVTIDNIVSMASKFGGIAIPAHVTRQSNSVLAVLGGISPDWGFETLEINAGNTVALDGEYAEKYNIVYNSDAHTLGAINECGENFIDCKSVSIIEILSALKTRKNIQEKL